MNITPRQQYTDADLQRRASIFTILDEIGKALDLTETQIQRARQAYRAVGGWLSGSEDPLLAETAVYLQGSSALGTAVKPIDREEFDVDLICFCATVVADVPPTHLKKAVGNRLREHKTYSPILEEKKRCWRLNYKDHFHLDLSPTIANPNCRNGGELVPDRKLRGWHPTNPRAYKAKFDERASLKPRLVHSTVVSKHAQAKVEPFPVRQTAKGILRRTVQLLKHHRDVFFKDNTDEIAPISIIITTLAMRAYECSVHRQIFEDELEVLIETIRMMPNFIERAIIDGRETYAVWNETTQGENFAEGWNNDLRKAKAFDAWHAAALSHFKTLLKCVGQDQLIRKMELCFGDRIVKPVFDKYIDTISDARTSGHLLIASSVGLTTSKAADAAIPVRSNTFFGGQ